ncbi:MAG: Nre family DNA repair protein [Candidatus Thorarchaeota archaeon]
MPQMSLGSKVDPTPSYDDRVCSRCQGHRALCGVNPCPLLMRAKAMANIDTAFTGMNLEGSSPPSVFVGTYGYPKVIAGPLVPPVKGDETFLMERPDLWLTKSLDEILAIRFSLVRTKKVMPVDAAVEPPRILSETQTMALSEAPTASEATLIKRPSFTRVFTGKTLPIGPSAPLETFRLEDNPKVPKAVDQITTDTDLNATKGVMSLFRDGIRAEHMTRLLSVGLLGEKKRRKLVPTLWSITAVDDIIGKQLHKQVLRLPWMNEYHVYADYALGNTVIILLLPSCWQFEALECWLGGLKPLVMTDHEWFKGRKTYASDITGAYYATRLPVLNHLAYRGKQAGAIVFMEVDPTRWVPLGVWRFREIAERALSVSGKKFNTLDEVIQEIDSHLRTPVSSWLDVSAVYKEFNTQTLITDFF